MIKLESLDNIWESLKYSGNSEFEFRRIDNISIPEINIGLNSKFNRCMLLELPSEHNVDFQTMAKKNLTLSFFKDTGYIVLELTDSDYFDLFNDLIISIYSYIYELNNVNEYSKIFIQMFYKWSEFFDDKASDKLSLESIKGIFGELFVLRNLIEKSDSFKLNDTLNSWRGLYDEAHDFVFEDKNVEVKTKDVSHLAVKIASEYQLEEELDKGLELLVLSVDIDYVKGDSLRSMVDKIKELTVNKMGDFSIVLTALAQKNISMSNIYQYDNYRFIVHEQAVYDCRKEGFPRLTKINTPNAVANIRYTLQLSYLANYLISKESFND